MHVVVDFHRQIKVDDVRDAIDVDAASGQVRRNQHGRSTALEAVECSLALRLRAVSVNRFHAETGRIQLIGDAIGRMFGLDKDQCACHFR